MFEHDVEKKMASTITTIIDVKRELQAEEVFNGPGLTLPGAVGVFIDERVKYQGIPFLIRGGMSEDDMLIAC